MPKTRQITKIDVVSSRTYELGDLINNVPIAVFSDKSVELSDGRIDSLYLAKDEKGELLLSIERCSVVVYYRNIDIEEEIQELNIDMEEALRDIPDLTDDLEEEIEELEED